VNVDNFRSTLDTPESPVTSAAPQNPSVDVPV
jgi:hypothetical protein